MLVRLLYVSRAVGEHNVDTVAAILRQSRTYNTAAGITGVLCAAGDTFMQVLEGGRVAVNRLYGNILRDGRHRDVTLLCYEEIDARMFAAWSMGQVNLSRLNPALVLKYSESAELDPYAVSGTASFALFADLVANAAIIG